MVKTLPKQNRVWKWLGINICRLLISATFLFSGVVKLVDPRGTQYKIEDYAALFGMHSLVQGIGALILSVALGTLEFYIGFNIFFGIRRRTTTRLALLLLLLLTPITLFIIISGVHMDCGCFGDAVTLTSGQTFAKNVVMLTAATVTVVYYRSMPRLITEGNQWLLSLYEIPFAIGLALYSINYLPVMDFRPYSIGVDLPEAIEREWKQSEGEPKYADFAVQTLEGEDITFQWLTVLGYKFLLVLPNLDEADDGTMDEANSIYEYSLLHGYPFLALTSSTIEAIDRWKDLTGGEYEFAQTDGTVLKTMIRSNPGLLLLHDGVIYQKWPCSSFPKLDIQSKPLEEHEVGQLQKNDRLRTIYRLLLWFLVPIFGWTIIDRLWVGRKYFKEHHKKENT